MDICIQSFVPQNRVVGIEVKTVEESVEPGQVERYRAGLKAKFRDFTIQIAYITPFNRDMPELGQAHSPASWSSNDSRNRIHKRVMLVGLTWESYVGMSTPCGGSIKLMCGSTYRLRNNCGRV